MQEYDIINSDDKSIRPTNYRIILQTSVRTKENLLNDYTSCRIMTEYVGNYKKRPILLALATLAIASPIWLRFFSGTVSIQLFDPYSPGLFLASFSQVFFGGFILFMHSS